MKVHLITVVGAQHTQLLGQMLKHYSILGISSFLVHAHLRSPDDNALAALRSVVAKFDHDIESVGYGDHAVTQRQAWDSRKRKPDDWFVIADVDEFQAYPSSIQAVITHCEERGYDHVKGCFLDRVASNGTLTQINTEQSLWDQYPMGLFLTYPILRADPRKVVAARGSVDMANNGHHVALSEKGCPITDYFIPVHHFKWVEGVLEALERRIDFVRRNSTSPHWQESQRFLDYYRERGRVDFDDPALFAARCDPDYPHWSILRNLFIEHGLS